MKHYMHLKNKPFQKIWNGEKTIELRLFDEKRKLIRVGDQIEFENISCSAQKILTTVTGVHVFESFEKLYESLPLEKCGYNSCEIKSASAADMNIYYSEEEQEKNGVVGIEFTVEKKSKTDITTISRFVSLVLRHKPEEAGIILDPHGWANVEDLIAGMKNKYPIDMEILEMIVKTDNKQRYSFNDDKTLIRANQGHSVKVDVELEKAVPPEYLWHGTAEKYVQSINEKGLIPKSRLYVHLSADVATAKNVGERHGKVVIYRIEAQRMHQQGIEFYRSANGVWLTKAVPVEFMELVELTEELSEQ